MSGSPLDRVMTTYIIEVQGSGGSEWEIRVADKGRHNGKLIAACPTELLSRVVRAALCHTDAILVEGYDLDIMFEVKEATPEYTEYKTEDLEQWKLDAQINEAERLEEEQDEEYERRYYND